jgi:hypothetical protein
MRINSMVELPDTLYPGFSMNFNRNLKNLVYLIEVPCRNPATDR